jgi:solute carrier family 50 protein (sugar transporter)
MSSVRNISDFAVSVAVIASISSQLMNLSAIPSIYKIYRAKSTLLYPAFPFVISSVAALCGITYAIITSQKVVLLSTSISITQALTYLSFHLHYSLEPQRILRTFAYLAIIELSCMLAGPLVVCTIGNAETCSSFSVGWIGVICTTVYSLVYCGQLTTLKQVIETKNSASISPWLTAGTLFCALIWTWYSVLVSDQFYLVSSLVGDISGITQVVCIMKYPAILPTSGSDDQVPMKESIIGTKRGEILNESIDSTELKTVK